MIREVFSDFTLYLFFIFAGVGLLEMIFFLYRIYSYSNSAQTLKLLEQHLEEGFDRDEVSEEFYERHREILDGP